jgi:two-component system response regulator FlrC
MRRILIVDDDRQMVETLSDVLRLRGWDPEGAFSGEEAIDVLRRGPFAAVVMDIKMPGIDGVTALKRMRDEWPELPVVLMTAHASKDLIVEAEQAGAARVFPKPVEPAVLLQHLDLTLSRSPDLS